MGLLIAYNVSPYYYYVRAVGLLIQPVQYLYTSSTVDFQLFRLNRYFVPTIVPKNWYTYELREFHGSCQRILFGIASLRSKK